MTTPIPGDEASKAVQEVAKTTGKAIGAIEKFGSFIARFVGGPLEQAAGIYEDKLKFMRWERQARLMERASELASQIGAKLPFQPIPLKIAIPLLEAASLEDDDYLQDLWARLLVGAATKLAGASLTRAHVSILEQLSPLEALVLQTIYTLSYEDVRHTGILTADLPTSVTRHPQTERVIPPDPTPEVCLALANLARVGCITLHRSMGGGEFFSIVHPTLLGLSLVQACTLVVL
jgi:Abortive infection alpha